MSSPSSCYQACGHYFFFDKHLTATSLPSATVRPTTRNSIEGEAKEGERTQEQP